MAVDKKQAEDNYFDKDSWEKVFKAEKQRLGKDNKLSGLAVSGGGIRSASFGLGVMQALVANRRLSEIDYMSTVSGGGYIGSALTWALYQDKQKKYGTTPDDFPLGKRVTFSDTKDPNVKKSSFLEDNKLLDFIRLHGSYLTPTKSLDLVSFAAVVVRSMIMSLFVYLSFITILMTVSLYLLYQFAGEVGLNSVVTNFVMGIMQFFDKSASYTEDYSKDYNQGLLMLVGLAILALMVLWGFLFSLKTFKLRSREASPASPKRYSKFVGNQIAMGWFLRLAIYCLVLGSLPFVTVLLSTVISKVLAVGGSTIFGAIIGLWQYKKARNNEQNTGGSSDLLIYAGAFALFYGIILLAYIIATRIFLIPDSNYIFNQSYYYWFFILGAASLLFGLIVNLNYIGPHYLWRSRLMEAFMPDDDPAVKNNVWDKAKGADTALMADMCPKERPRPYHIVNTNVILSNSKNIESSGRGGDNFIVSPLFCGSDATGWKSTREFQSDGSRGITLATAMATSAAALNPNAAVSGEGVTRNVVISVLLSMLNLRLGYWMKNPKNGLKRMKGLFSPNFFDPGLKTEIFRSGLTEDESNLLLSDGGHYENLGLYELVRRKLDLIIVSDGGADPLFNFDDLSNAIEKVRVDFGAKIIFKPGYMTDDILPGTSGDSSYQKKYNISRHAFAFAKIIYEDKSEGTLVYVKLAMIEGMSTDVYSYKGIHPDFPHQSTADQFFDEKQFEAYRELGYSVGWQMLVSKEGNKIFGLSLKIENRIMIKANAAVVWDALTNPEKTQKYMYGRAVDSDWKPGNKVNWKGFVNGIEKIMVTGTVVKNKAKELLEYTVIDPNPSYPDIPENHVHVTYTLTEQGGNTMLTVSEEGFEKAAEGERRYKEAYNNGEQWNPILLKIKELVEADNKSD